MWFWLILNVLVGGMWLGAGCFFLRRRCYRRTAIFIIVGLFNTYVAVVVSQALYNVTWGECADAPAEVPFHQGMTLCPGQSTTIKVIIDKDNGKDI